MAITAIVETEKKEAKFRTTKRSNNEIKNQIMVLVDGVKINV